MYIIYVVIKSCTQFKKLIYHYFFFFPAKEILFDCADESVNTAECKNDKCYCTGKADKPCTSFSSGIVNKGNGNTENGNSASAKTINTLVAFSCFTFVLSKVVY